MDFVIQFNFVGNIGQKRIDALKESIRIARIHNKGKFSIPIGMAIGHALKKAGIDPTKTVKLSTGENRAEWYRAIKTVMEVYQALR